MMVNIGNLQKVMTFFYYFRRGKFVSKLTSKNLLERHSLVLRYYIYFFNFKNNVTAIRDDILLYKLLIQ